MKHVLALIIVFSIFAQFSHGQKQNRFQYVGLGLNNIVNLKLNDIIESNSLNSAPLNLIEFDYGINYSPKSLGAFLEANYSFFSKDLSSTSIQSFRLGVDYKIPLTDKLNVKFGGFYSYSGIRILVNNATNSDIYYNSLNTANGGNIIFHCKNNSAGGVVTFCFKNVALRVLYDVSLDEINWQILNNNANGFKNELISKVFVGLVYKY